MHILRSRPLRRHHALVASVVAVLAGFVLSSGAQAANPDPTQYGIDSVNASLSTTQAGAHPDLTTTINLKLTADGFPYAGTQNVSVGLPPGLVGNPTPFPNCAVSLFVASATSTNPPCPIDTQVGVVNIGLNIGCSGCDFVLTEPLYNLPASADSPARLGFIAVDVPVLIDFKLRSDSDYGLTAVARGAQDLFPVTSIQTVTWGVPADPSHDGLRMTPSEAVNCGSPCTAPGGTRPSGLARVPFMTNPTNCDPGKQVDFATTAYPLPGQTFTASAPVPDITGCGSVPFDPSISLHPTTSTAGSPSGLDVDLQQSQDGLEHPNTLAPAHLRKTVVTLPQGMTLNPSAADGLAGCTEAQVGLTSESPVQFNTADPSCPDSSKVGTAEITTPLLPDPLEGSLYLASQNDNPFHSLLSGYLVAKGQGVIIKLAGRFDLDPRTGQITATFDNNPQQPFSDLKLHFNGGSRGVLVTPTSCGTYQIQSELTPWSGTAPVTRTDSFTIDQGCGGGGFNPGFEAGLTNPVAASSSSFVLRLTRQDGEQNISGLTTTLPPGLAAKIAGVPLCPEAQAATGDCPASSQVGSTTVGVGAGPSPVFIPQAGNAPTTVYLAGPYEGAPYSLVIRVPAQAGPFDLGTVTVRAAIFIDPTDAHVTVVSDPLPQIIQGIPLPYRDIRVTIDRPGFMVAPTSCDAMQVSADVAGAPLGGPINLGANEVGYAASAGTVAHLASRFQVGGCQALGFTPRFSMKLTGRGQTTDGKHPALVTTLTQPAGQADIKSAQVALPLSLALDPLNSQHVCDHDLAAAVHGGAANCPASTNVGTATAVTPLLPHPLSGPVYLVQGLRTNKFGRVVRTLPTLLVPLRGADNVAFDLRAHTSVVRKKLVTTFDNIPDAPVSRFTLTINGGRHGIIVVTHNQNICSKKQVTAATLAAQNGRQRNQSVTMSRPCGHMSSRVGVRRTSWRGHRLLVGGTVARHAHARVKVTLHCSHTTISRRVRPHSGRWVAALKLRGTCLTARRGRVTATYLGGPSYRKGHASRLVRRT